MNGRRIRRVRSFRDTPENPVPLVLGRAIELAPVRLVQLGGKQRGVGIALFRSAKGATLAPDDQRLAVGGADAVSVWDFVAQRELLTLDGGGRWFFDLKFSPDGNTLAATPLTGMSHLWHAPSWEEIEEAEKKQSRLPEDVAASR